MGNVHRLGCLELVGIAEISFFRQRLVICLRRILRYLVQPRISQFFLGRQRHPLLHDGFLVVPGFATRFRQRTVAQQRLDDLVDPFTVADKDQPVLRRHLVKRRVDLTLGQHNIALNGERRHRSRHGRRPRQSTTMLQYILNSWSLRYAQTDTFKAE